jgi:hypothetical protein
LPRPDEDEADEGDRVFQLAQFELSRLEHHHGGNEWHTMYEVSEAHDPAQSDPERQWARGRIFRCSTCEDEIRVSGADPAPIEGARTGSFDAAERR